jgi:hypothetical protein
MRVLEINAPFSWGGITGKMNDNKSSLAKKQTTPLDHDAKARMAQLSKAQEKWEKDKNSSNNSLSNGDK